MGIKKIFSVLATGVIVTSLFGGAGISAAGNLNENENKPHELEYNELLTNIEEQINTLQQNSENLTIDDRESISEEYSELVSNYLKKNGDSLTEDQLIELTDELGEIDRSMYNVELEKGQTEFGKLSEDFIPSETKDAPQKAGEFGTYANQGPGAGTSWSQRRGSILVSMTAKRYGFPHGHAAIISNTSGYVIEALPKPGVTHQPAHTYWSTVSDEVEMYVKKASWANYDQAIKYAKSQIGDPYKLKTTINNTSNWYCSKLVYKAFKSAGHDLALGSPYPLPLDLKVDKNTVTLYKNPF
ncbi:YiiX/YebB-like N1pC/P60 family cysteine hydrolase [Rossellomorea marisflavi]|uniref:YiiX/YebB-like N1pC/P60 family cysteine hydrolase n=1 Tax=Rossellomorea marisflavi TaxID=189381 RepID=UPI00069D310F|nr:YiiX/YebB-like N1pC/P60 family cysteine hydrolase [Rossellomorea marisflavi]